VLVDTAGTVLDGAGHWEHPIFARSSTKALQALPLVESGAADRFSFRDDELALALASHDAEAIHTERVAALLARLGLTPAHLRCGAHPPTGSEAWRELVRAGAEPSALHNSCSGKHAGFLALALHLGDDLERYLDPASHGQLLVRRAMEQMTGLEPARLSRAVDGCSAPTFRLPLRSLAAALARLTEPSGLPAPRRDACLRLAAAAAAWPELIGGTRKRLDTDLSRVSGGRLMAKVGAEAVYVVGERGAGRALAVKIDDGGLRGLHAVVLALLERHGFLDAHQLVELARLGDGRAGPVRNSAGLEVGRLEVVA
jgi:L-asparaginase II